MNWERLNSSGSTRGEGCGAGMEIVSHCPQVGYPFFYRYPPVAAKRCCPLTSKRPTRFSIGGNQRSNCDDSPCGPDDKPPQGKSTCARPNVERPPTSPCLPVQPPPAELISYCGRKKFVLAGLLSLLSFTFLISLPVFNTRVLFFFLSSFLSSLLSFFFRLFLPLLSGELWFLAKSTYRVGICRGDLL